MKTLIFVDRIIHLDGTGSSPACIVINEEGRTVAVDTTYTLAQEPDSVLVDRRGHTALPLLADAHTHLGISDDVTESPDFHRLEIINCQLRNYLEHGVGHVLSLGTDQPWLQEELDRRRTIRDLKGLAIGYSAGTGFGAIDGWPPELTMPEPRFRPATPEVARSQVRKLAERGIRVLKIWVDDFGGKVPKIPVPIIQAIIDEARRNDIKTFAHIFFLSDSIDVVDAGIHVLAHSVRDTRISKSFADKMAQQGVTLAPTLAREEAELAFTGEDNPYFENALFRECAGTRLDQLRGLRTGGDRTRDELSRKLELALVNFETISMAGVSVCLSTDSGFKMKIGGFSQHRELELLCSAGLSASASLKAALGKNKDLFANDLAAIAPGEKASFFLVRGNPLQEIAQTQRIAEVWFEGQQTTSNLAPSGE